MANEVRIRASVDDKVSGPLDRIRDKFDHVGKSGGFKSLVQGVGVGVGAAAFNALGGAVSGVVDTIVSSIPKAMAFERGMLNINSIAKVSATELAAMGKTVLRMSGEFGQSADTMTTALYDINSSGFAGAKGIEVLRAATKAATAGLATTAEAASGITAVLNSYGLKASEAGKVSDVLFKTVERGVVTFPELSAEIGKTAALASPLGVSLEEVGAALAVMTRHGLGAEDATTQLNAIMASMLKPAGDATVLAKQLGIDWSAAGLKANGLTGQLNAMIKATGGSEAEMAVLLGDVRAIRGAFAVAARGGAELNEELKVMEDAAGATEAAFGIQSQGAAFKMAQATAKLDAALTSLGTNALPAVADGADTASVALDLMTNGLPQTTEGILDAAEAMSRLAPGPFGQMFRDEVDRSRAALEDLDGGVEGFISAAAARDREYAQVAVKLASELPKAIDAAGKKAKVNLDARINELISTLTGRRGAFEEAAAGVADATWDPQINAAELALVNLALKDKDLLERLESKDKKVRLAAEIEYANLKKDQARLRAAVQTDSEQSQEELDAALAKRKKLVENRGNQLAAAAIADARVAASALPDAVGKTVKATDTAAKRHADRLKTRLDLEDKTYVWGEHAGQAFGDGLASMYYYVNQAAKELASGARGPLEFTEPKEGPLRGMKTWGQHAGQLWADALSSQAPYLKDKVGKYLAGADGLSPGLSRPSGSSGGRFDGSGAPITVVFQVDSREVARAIFDRSGRPTLTPA